MCLSITQLQRFTTTMQAKVTDKTNYFVGDISLLSPDARVDS